MQKGDSVRHATYGIGTIKKVCVDQDCGRGMLLVAFPVHGELWVDVMEVVAAEQQEN